MNQNHESDWESGRTRLGVLSLWTRLGSLLHPDWWVDMSRRASARERERERERGLPGRDGKGRNGVELLSSKDVDK